MITLKSCPNCKSTGFVAYPQAGLAPQVNHEIMPGAKINAAVITRYLVCQKCGLISQSPRMSDRELDEFYSQGFYRRTLNLTDEEKDKDELYRARFDTEIIRRHIGKVASHLDMGCSRGFLLKEVGASVEVGVEADVDGVKAKGIEVYSKMNQVPQKSFDLVTAIHVLEHVSKPAGYLQKMAKFVKKSGYLVIEVPTWKSPGGPLRLAHLYHFEPDVLKLICKQVGLQVEHTEFTPHLMLICKHNK